MLKSLPDDIVLLAIFNYLDGYDLISYLKLSKYFHNCNTNFKKIIKSKINNEKEKFTRIKELYHKIIIDMMGGVKCMTKLPLLEWKMDYLTQNGRLSRIHPTDIDHPIMLGFDEIYHRPFISFHTKLNNTNEKNICTLYQRDKYSKKSWVNVCKNWDFIDYNIEENLLPINVCNFMHNKKYLHCCFEEYYTNIDQQYKLSGQEYLFK